MQLFLATETYSQLCLTEKQQSGAQPGCRSCIKLDQGLILLVSFLPWQCSQLLCCFPLSELERAREMGACCPGTSLQRSEKLGLSCCCASDFIPTTMILSLPVLLLPPGPVLTFHHPCLSCTVQSLEIPKETFSQHLVTHPGAFFFCRKLICLPLPLQTLSFLFVKKNIVTVISPQERMKEVWTKAGPLKLPLLAYV